MMHRRLLTLMLVTLAAAIPAAASADVELYFEAAPQARPGAAVPVLLKARITESINAVKTVIRFDPTRMAITAADDNGAVIRYWLSRPEPSTSGSLALEGIIPGGVGPGFTDTVLLAHLTVVPSRTGPATLTLDDTLVYLNQPDPKEAKVTVRPLTIAVATDAPDVIMTGAVATDDDIVVRIVSEPGINGGAWSLVFDIRTASGSLDTVLLRERRFGLGGTWRTVSNTEQLSDQTLTSILEVAVPDGDDQRIVRTIVPSRLKALWAIAAAVMIASVIALRRRAMT